MAVPQHPIPKAIQAPYLTNGLKLYANKETYYGTFYG